jgi:transposase
MKRRNWANEEKFKIILDGLQNRISVAELCTKHKIQQSQYYSWRDKFLRDGANVFQSNDTSKREEQLKSKMSKMEQIIGKLTLELKKND